MEGREGGLLGDLPRSRPGTRSPKRGEHKPSARAPEADEAGAATEPQPGVLASEALRAAAGVAETGLKVASRLTAEVIRRVPRL